MQVKLLIDHEMTNPAIKSMDQLNEIRNLYLAGKISPQEYQSRIKVFAPAGTIIDHPLAYGLVGCGVAEPVDQECIERVGQKRLARMAQMVEAAGLLDVAQATGTKADASDEAVERFKVARQKRREALQVADKVVSPAA